MYCYTEARNSTDGVPPRSIKPSSPPSACPPVPTPSLKLRYDLRKMKAHSLLERIGRSYRYRLSDKGAKAALI